MSSNLQLLYGSNGHLELNVFEPMIANALFHSVKLLGDASASFEKICVRRIQVNREVIAKLLHEKCIIVEKLVEEIVDDGQHPRTLVGTCEEGKGYDEGITRS